MASSDDFREQLKAGNITEALALALSKAVELKITTWVASGADDLEANRAKPGHRLHTRINTIDGDIENEIGDQFINNGLYRELRQFHLEQVAEGNKIIQNNLQSLQKLFEILVATRYQAATTPAIEPEFLDVDTPLWPTVESVTDAGIVIEPPEAVVEESVVSPDTVAEDLTGAGFVIEPQAPAVEDTVASADTLTEEDVAQLQPTPLEQPSSLPTPTADSQEELEAEEEDEDDWDDSVLDLLESLPVEPPPILEASDSEVDEDWGDLVEPDPVALDSDADQDWGILTLDDFDEPPTSPEPTLKTVDSDLDEDWGDLIEPEAEPKPDKPVPSIESLNLEEDEDWAEWVVEDQEPSPNEPVADRSLLDLEEEEDWGDLDEDSEPFVAASESDRSVSNLDDLEEDWDGFAAEELEPFSDFLNEDTEDESFDPLENLTSTESANPDLRDNLEIDSSTENDLLDEFDRFPEMPDAIDGSEDATRDPIDVLFEETESPESQPDSAIPDDDIVHSLEEALFSQSPEEESEKDVSTEDSGEETSEEQSNTHPKPSDRRVPPPPPPPRRFPHRNH